MRTATSQGRILVVDDDPDYGPMLRQRLRREGFTAELATAGHAGLFKAQFFKPRLILLDIHMPGLNGIVLHKALRRAPQTRGIPLILITGLDVLDDLLEAAVAGLQADPVFRKPDGLDVLVERIRRTLQSLVDKSKQPDAATSPLMPSAEMPRRGNPAAPGEPRHYDWDGLKFYPELRRAIADGEAVKLNNKEASLFEIFIRNPGMVQGSERLWEAVWSAPRAKGWRHTLDSRVSSLRKKLGEKRGRRLVCQKNEGYVLLPRSCQD